MSNTAAESQQSAMSRILSNIASIQSLFPVLWDPMENIPQATWPDRLGLIDRPESVWDSIRQPYISLCLQQLQSSKHSHKMLNGQMYIMEHSDVYGPQEEIRHMASGVATIQSLFPDLWDHVDDSPQDVWRIRPEDARRPVSPSNRVQQPYHLPFVAQQHHFLGPIGRPRFENENEEDWSESESEYDDDRESEYYYDSGIDSASDTESNLTMEEQGLNIDPDRGIMFDRSFYVDKEYYCPSCGKIYIQRYYANHLDYVD